MNPDKNKEFENNMNQLIRILKKLLKNIPGQAPFSNFQNPSASGEGSVHLNLCFFSFFPLSPEELDEFEEAWEQAYYQDDKGEELSAELTPSDVEFLRRHGMRF